MDPLSRMLALLRPQAVGWRLIEAHNAWSLRFPPVRDTVVFGQIIEGRCDMQREDGQTCTLSAGDFLLMASPPPWSMRALAGGPRVDFKALLSDPALLRLSGTPALVTRFIAGYFTYATVGADLLTRLMLPVIQVRAGEVAAGRLGTLLSLLGDEAMKDRSGRSHVLERLLELILVEVLRQPGFGWDQTGPGMLKGLADPRIAKALRLMHADGACRCTVADLARAAAMSRSAFAAHFAQVVGLPPISYLSSWRMALARQALETNSRPMAEIAELAGYRSVSAFSTAFRRQTGLSPTAHIRSNGREPAPEPQPRRPLQ